MEKINRIKKAAEILGVDLKIKILESVVDRKENKLVISMTGVSNDDLEIIRKLLANYIGVL